MGGESVTSENSRSDYLRYEREDQSEETFLEHEYLWCPTDEQLEMLTHGD